MMQKIEKLDNQDELRAMVAATRALLFRNKPSEEEWKRKAREKRFPKPQEEKKVVVEDFFDIRR